jgi:hypothetical protein
MLSQPGIGGQAPPDGRPIAAIGSIQRTRPGRPVLLRAAGFDPASPHVRLRYTWAFGDGTTATGAAVRHAYARAGRYPLRLTITGRGLAPRVIRQPLAVGQQATYRNPYLAGRRHPRSAIARAAEAGKPPANPLVTLPAATSGLTDKVRLAPAARPAPARSQPVAWILTGVVAAALAIAAIILAARRRAARGRRLS